MSPYDDTTTRLLDSEKTSLDGSMESDDYEVPTREPLPRRGYLIYHFCFWIAYTGIFIVALAIVLSSRRANASTLRPTRNSPLRAAIEYENRVVNYNFAETNAFHGQPLADIEAEWTYLLNGGSNIRASAVQMADMNISSIQIADGTEDYLVKPVAYHMLHCLYNLYRYVHPDFYGEDPGGKDWVRIHSDHCIDNLRQFVQCHADDGVGTFRWLRRKKLPWPVLSAEETCVNWPKFDTWVREHAADEQQLRVGALVHPHLGPLTPEDWISDEKLHVVHSPEDFEKE